MTITEPSVAERAKLEQKRGLATVTRGFAVEGLEVRAPAEGSTIAEFQGHASVTDTPYEMYGGPDKGGWNETVDRGAFKRTLGRKPDVAFLVNHEGLTLARTTAGTLHLSEDSTGLAVKASLDTRDTNVNNLVVQMEAGNITEMSFAFRVTSQQWLNADGEEVPWWDLTGIDRHIQAVDINKGDVSAVNYGANPYTDAALRSLADLRGLPLDDCTADELREAIAYLESRVTQIMLHDFVDDDGSGTCDVCNSPEAMHGTQQNSVHPDLVAAQHRAYQRGAALL